MDAVDGEAINDENGCSILVADCGTSITVVRFNKAKTIRVARHYTWSGSSWVQSITDNNVDTIEPLLLPPPSLIDIVSIFLETAK